MEVAGGARELLRRYRLRVGMTQDELAAGAGLALRTVRDIEGGRVRAPRERSLSALAAALALSDAECRELRAALVGVTADRTPWVGVLGPLSVSRGGGAIDPGPRQRRQLLGLLALRLGHAVSREEIVDVLWGDRPPRTCATAVQVHVARLREVLGARPAARADRGPIALAGGGYRLEPGWIRVDLAEFDRLTNQARQALATADPAGAIEKFEQALRWWRGPVLADLGDGLRQHPDAVAAAQRRVAAAVACADAALELGCAARVVAMLRTLTGEEPLHEGLHARLMLALDAAGESAEALRLYAQVRELLRAELGTEPGAQMRAAHLHVLRASLPSVGPERPPSRAAQLPADAVAFVGRREALRRLDEVRDGGAANGARSVVISGTAGVGKTALAVHWAHLAADEFPDGQLYVDLQGFAPAAAAMSPGDALRHLLDALDVSPQRIPASVDDRVGLFRSLLAGRRALVVLDNARDAEQVRPLLPGSRHCLAVVTSRNELVGLVATEGAVPLALQPLAPPEARELLDRRIGAARVAAEPAAVAELIACCAGLPLALAIVAARAAIRPELRLTDLAAQLSLAQGLDALGGDDLATDLRAVFSWSYRAVSPAAARLFRLLGLHAGPHIGAAAAASLAAVPVTFAKRLLGELARGHLVTEVSPGRFGFHDLLRTYAAEQTQVMDGDDERRTAAQRTLDHYVHTGHRAALLLEPHRIPMALGPLLPGVAPERPEDSRQALAWYATEHRVLLAAFAPAAALGFDVHIGQLAWTLTDYLQRRGLWPEQADVHRHALDAARRRSDVPGMARAHRHLSRAEILLGNYAAASAHAHHALDLCRDIGDLEGQANICMNLAHIAEDQGDLRGALGHARHALHLFRSAGDRDGEARSLNTVGWFCARVGDQGHALAYCQRALVLLREVGDPTGEAHTLDSLGHVHHRTGDHERAVECFRHSIALFSDLGDRFPAATALSRLGDVHHDSGDTAAAREAWRRALQIFEELDHPEAAGVRVKLDQVDHVDGGGG